MSKYDRAEYRFGYAAFAEASDVHTSGLISGAHSLHLGYWGHLPLSLASDGPQLLIGGARTGKLTTLLAYDAIGCPEPCVISDPKGEIAALSIGAQVMMSKRAYCINPLKMHRHILPSHSVDVLSFIKRGSISLTSDTKLICKDLIAERATGDNAFFEGRARGWLEAFIKGDALWHGSANLKRVGKYARALTGKIEDWIELAAHLAATAPEVAATMREINSYRKNGSKAFDGIVGELANALSFLTDDALQSTVDENADFTVEDICDPKKPANCYICVPAELMEVWAPFLRLLVGAMMIVKGRKPDAPRVNFIVDEAGQLGRADFLVRAFTFGGGLGIRAKAVFQDIGQIRRNFGADAATTFMGSAQVRQFIGVRDHTTAKLISEMLGEETLEYADPLQQNRADLARRKAANAVLNGADPFSVARDLRHHKDASEHLMKQKRALMTSAEVLALDGQDQVLFVSDIGCPPILAQRYPYFLNPAAAGRYLPNPYHPPLDHVQIVQGGRQVWRRVIEEDVPESYQHLPQYQQTGSWHYVEGFRPAVHPLP